MRVSDVLASASIDRADAEILLAAACGKDRTWLLAHGEEILPDRARGRWEEWADRRAGGEPVAYILGEKEFHGRSFSVDRSTLIPRPATEGLVESAFAFLETGKGSRVPVDAGIVALALPLRPGPAETVADVGTGSGCIAVTLKLLRPDLAVIATDVSRAALALAEKNARRHGADVGIREGEGMAPLRDLDRPFVVVSNPPYIPDGTPLPRDVAEHEPRGALFAGPDGMDVLRPLVRDAAAHPFCVGLVVECREDQADAVEGLTRDAGGR